MFKRTTQLFILALLLSLFMTTVYTQEAAKSDDRSLKNDEKLRDFDDNDDESANEDVLNEEWTCNHDKETQIEPEEVDVEEEGLKDAQGGRLLQQANYPNFRIYGYTGSMTGSASYRNYLANKLLPPIISYFEGALKVKYPVSGPLRINSNSLCGIATPSVLRSGVNADFVYIFASTSGVSWVASTQSCQMATGSRRPLVGATTVNTGKFRETTDVMLHERNMYAIMHELTHTLGFSSSLFPRFIDNNGRQLQGHITRTNLDGMSTTILDVPPLTQMVRDHFGCQSIRGAYLENNGQAGAVAGSHFERRHYGFEAMTAYLLYEMKLSKFTLALLEGSGWYVANYEFADPFHWGQGQGCNFLTASCANANYQFSEFCSSGARSCSNPGRGGGGCSGDQVSGQCKFIHPSVSYDCSNSGAASYARLPNIQTFGRGTGSKCFEGTLGGGSQTTFCFKPTCSGSGADTILNLQVGSQTVACTRAGYVSVAGYSGSLKCPDPQTFCATVGKKVCPRNCMGRGKCVNGFCQCYSGFQGEDCAL